MTISDRDKIAAFLVAHDLSADVAEAMDVSSWAFAAFGAECEAPNTQEIAEIVARMRQIEGGKS